MKRWIRRLFKLGFTSALLGGALYAGSDAFARRWHGLVIQQLAERGLHLDFQKLRINPFGGLVAREVRVYAKPDRVQLLAAVDHLNLDFDFGRLFEKKFVVQGLELHDARVALPIDEAGTEVLELSELNARAFLRDGRLEINQAQGLLSGIRIHVSGELTLPPKEDKQPDEKRPSALQRLELLHSHQQRIQRGLEWLKRFQFDSAPQLHLHMHGEMERIREGKARLFFEVQGLSYGDYHCRELLAEAEYNAGMMNLTRFHLRDSTGRVNASASWQMGSEQLRFHLTSSADLPALAQAFLDSDNLREVVFYETPHLALDGLWYVDGPLAKHKRPVRVAGRLECGRFNSRGAVFDGLEANIGVAPEGVYIRDLRLRHESGTLDAQALVHETEGFRYRALLRMDPNAFLPFAKMEQTREIIRRFQFNRQSSIHLELEGQGPEADLQLCLNKGRGELRNFSYRGVELEFLAADIEFKDPHQHFRNVKLKRAEGEGEAAHIEIHDDEKWVRLEGVRTSVDPVAVTGCFAPKTAAHIAKYRLPNTTKVSLDGFVYYRDDQRTDLKVSFSHTTGSGRYVFLGDEYNVVAPVGDLRIVGETLQFDIRGQVLGDAMRAKGSVDFTGEDDEDYAVTVTARRFPYEVFGKKLPFDNVSAEIANRGQKTNFDIRSSLLGGSLSLKGSFNDDTRPYAYQGELRLDGVSFQRFAQMYTKDSDTEGDITGHFRFVGREGDWKALKGGGAAIILNGNLYSVPILGPLTPMLGSILPGQIKGYYIAKEANCTFEVADGFVITRDFEALTSVFKIASSGRIDFIRDEVDLSAQVRVRGLPGLVFLPFSELLEYHGQGSITNTDWKPSLLKNASGTKPTGRTPPDAASLRAAERIAEDTEQPKSVSPPPRKNPSMFNRAGGR